MTKKIQTSYLNEAELKQAAENLDLGRKVLDIMTCTSEEDIKGSKITEKTLIQAQQIVLNRNLIESLFKDAKHNASRDLKRADDHLREHFTKGVGGKSGSHVEMLKALNTIRGGLEAYYKLRYPALVRKEMEVSKEKQVQERLGSENKI